MLNLYITDLKKIIKDKLFLVTCILAAILAIGNPLTYKLLFDALGVGELLGDLMSAKSLFFSSFSPGNNIGVIMPILIAIIVCKDFSQGTVRNKIISGKSRTTIFISHFLSAATIMCAIMLIQGVLTLGVSLLFFGYQSEPFTAYDFGYLLISLVFEMIVYCAIAAIITYIATISKNMGVCIILYLAISFGASIIGTILQLAGAFVEPETTKYYVIEFINSLNFYVSSASVGAGSTYTAKGVLYILMGPAIFGVGSALVGICMFRKKDLK